MEDRANILRDMKICRFCLCNDESTLTNIYERQKPESKFSVPLPLQIMACSAIEVFINDGMPQQICSSCRTLTMQAYTFKTNCKKADDALKVFLATGQLSKPYMQKIDPVNMSNLKTLNHEQFSKEIRKQQKDYLDAVNMNSKHHTIQQEQNTIQQEENSMEYDEDMEFEESVDLKHFNDINNCSTPLTKTNSPAKTECFPCPHCERAFPLKQLLDLHITNHNREREFECGECSKKFYSKYDLSKHLLTHTVERSHNCFVCHKSFTRDSLLKRHEEKAHKDIQKFECEECGRRFLSQSHLTYHMEKHKRKRPFMCSVCNKSFVFRQGLERHMNVMHDENKPFKCNYCEASFHTALKLARHITSHAGLRPYPCKICNRTFLLSHHLTRHMRSHYAVRSSSFEGVIHQYKCDLCSMSFRRKDSLINHSAIHSMVNLRCVICNTSFETAQLVKEHITTHLSGLPFPCEKCDYSFETSHQLEEHELKHAEMEYEEQIEKEIITEAIEKGEIQLPPEDFSAVTEYIIDDLNNEELSIVPITKSNRTKSKSNRQQNEIAHQTEVENQQQMEQTTSKGRRESNKINIIDLDEVHTGNYVPFLKDEVDSDVEEMGIPKEANQEENEDAEQEEIEPIKPIVRQEGTKVYQRKAPIERKLPATLQEPIRMSSLEEPLQLQDTSTLRVRDLSPSTLSSLQTKKIVDMKMGNKVVKVQKFIITKEEMKAMAKQGILEIKNGQVVLKNASHPILNASLKPIHKTEIESLLERKSETKTQIKQYQKKTERPVIGGRMPESSFVEHTVTSECIDLDTSSMDASQTTIQTD